MVPLEVAASRRLDCDTTERACQQCLGLTRRARQLRKSGTLRFLEPHAYFQLRQEWSEILGTGLPSLSAPPPQEIQAQGRRAVGNWFKQRDAQLTRFARLAGLLNSVPPEMAWRLNMGCEIEVRTRKKRRRKSKAFDGE